MGGIEETLRRVRAREPSPGFLDAGLRRIASYRAAQVPSHAGWRYATIALAVLLSASTILNVALWRAEGAERDGRSVDDRSGSAYLAYSVLRPEGNLLVRETRYAYAGGDSDD